MVPRVTGNRASCDAELPAVVVAPEADADLVEWTLAHAPFWTRALTGHGAVLFRGFGVRGADDLRSVVEATSDDWAVYREAATPRRPVVSNIFTSTEYPRDQRIPLHNENSHCTSWPLKIYFHCQTAARVGGQTPLADCRGVLASLPSKLVEEFTARKWRYVRRFKGALGFEWQNVFETTDRTVVDEYCRANAMVPTWENGDALTVTYVRDAIRRHPQTGEIIWFNHGLFFNQASLPPEMRELVAGGFPADELPYDTFYGDGAPVPPTVIGDIQAAYDAQTREFDWQAGDLLMVDNMIVAHGRNSFDGERRILVGMADPVAISDACVD
jgi:alpha-ketoglutarate-dependent taurine dioxygenase